MIRKMLRVGTAVAVLAALASPAAGGPARSGRAIDKSDNLTLVRSFPFDGGSELAAQGKYLYAGQINGDAEFPSRNRVPEQGGVHIYDVSKKKPVKAGFLYCPGNDNDVESIKPGFIAVGHHTNVCNQPGNGLFIVDVRNPKRPKITGTVQLPGSGSSHTIKPYPGKPYVYVNPGGLNNGQGIEYIIDVSNVRKPEIAGTFTPNPMGCHDLSFHISKERQLAFCAGYGETQIWDVSDPVSPSTIGRIHNPLIQFMHYPVANSDGTLLAIDDEAFAAHECHTGQTPTGRVWIYDISNPALPVVQSSYAAPRGGDAAGIGHYTGWIPSWCLSHGLDWQPGTNNLAVTWFTGGVSVLNFDTPTSPQEVAHFQADDSATYSALWHKGRLYTNDSRRGVDVFDIKGLKGR